MTFALDDPSLANWPFHEQNHHLNILRPVIQKSLQRCWPRLHLDQETRISLDELSQLMQSNAKFLAIVEAVMGEISPFEDESHTAFMLVERSGYLIYLHGCEHITAFLQERSIELGSDLSEYGSGTNAFGLALIELAPIEVQGEEHFLQKFQGCYNAAAPIFGSAGRLLGAVGVFGLLENRSAQSLALATLAARAITEGVLANEAIEENTSKSERFNQILATNQDSLLVLDNDGVIHIANQASASLLGVEISKLVGEPFHRVIQLPEEVRAEIEAKNEVHELEIALMLKRKPVDCVISFLSLADGQGSVLYIRQPQDVRKLAMREYSSKGDFGLKDIHGVSAQIRKVRRQVRSAAQAKASTLIVGELGTGKSLVARVIHSLSELRDGPLVVFNCAALPHEMILSELQGAASMPGKHSNSRSSKFELADGGMLYFQDIDLLPLEGQEILLRVLKTGTIQQPGSNYRTEVQVRILAATCVALEDLVGEGKFNAELLRWLKVFQIELPALRDRKEDIPILANHILMRFSCRYRSNIEIAPESLNLLCIYDWPGNIRELELTMERAIYCLGNECMIKPVHLPLSLARLPGTTRLEYPVERAQPLTELQEEAFIQAARDCNGNLSEIARVLGIGRTTVWRWFKRMNISPDSFRSNKL